MKSRFLIVSLFFISYSTSFAQVKWDVDYLSILKRAGKYDATDTRQLPVFTYQSSSAPELMALRNNFNLDSIAGSGDQTSKLLHILHWVHNTVKHNGQQESGIQEINADAIIKASKERHVGVSCGELASTLNDCYLAMGWKSRKIYCFPKDSLRQDHDSHVINVVFLNEAGKWVWVDPTNDAYIMNEKGELLSIQEVRERLVNNKPLILNPDANYNHVSSLGKDYYLGTYMAKNLYRLYCPLNSEYDYETWGRNKRVIYVNLLPLDYTAKVPFKTDDYYNADVKTTFNNYYTFNPNIFWQSPADGSK